MTTEPQPQQSTSETPEPTATPEEFRLSIRMNRQQIDRVKALANLAAIRGVIEDNPKGNLTGWVNYCQQLGEELLKQQVAKDRLG